MKRIIFSLFILLFFLGISAQESDSILLEKVDILKKELGTLQKKNKSLQYRIYKLQKAHQTDVEEVTKKLEAADEALEKNNTDISRLAEDLEASEKNAVESLTVLGEWTKKMIMIFALIALVLILVLFILVITNRRRIERDYKKLEAKVDNTKEAIDLEIKNVLMRHEGDITALKDAIEKGKK